MSEDAGGRGHGLGVDLGERREQSLAGLGIGGERLREQGGGVTTLAGAPRGQRRAQDREGRGPRLAEVRERLRRVEPERG